MYTVECPHRHRKFRVQGPVSNVKMKCGKCNQAFQGSSVETPGAPGSSPAPAAPAIDPFGPSPAAGAAPSQAKPQFKRPAKSSGSPVMMAIVTLENVAGKELKAGATGQPAGASLVMWDISESNCRSEPTADGKVIWTGRTKNETGTSVKNVRVFAELFDERYEVEGARAEGKIVGAASIGRGMSQDFRVEFDQPGAEAYKVIVVRAVGEPY